MNFILNGYCRIISIMSLMILNPTVLSNSCECIMFTNISKIPYKTNFAITVYIKIQPGP